MRQRLIVLGYLALFWLLFELVIRALFLLYNHDYSAQLIATEVLQVFLNGLKMDISLLGYMMMAATLVVTISIFVKQRWPYSIFHVLVILSLVLGTFLASVDLELYRHWGFRLNTAPMFYLRTAGSEALGSIPPTVILKLLVIGGAVAAFFIYLYRRLLVCRVSALDQGSRRHAPVLLMLAGLMFIPIRGSFTVAPMNTGFVYFHKTKAYANHAAINVIWNFFYNLDRSKALKYPEDVLPREVAESHFRALHPPDDGRTKPIWKTARPNIIFFILESFTSDVIEPLGGMPGITPNLNDLCREGILYTNFYASGDRTDKGIVSILSGYPAQPVTSIIKNAAKTQRLAYLNHDMLALGYNTSFVYGGDIDFANFRSYLTNSRFDHITSDKDFPRELNQSKWGVHDHIVFAQALHECDTAAQPFFKVILSLSSHEPFDVPMTPAFPGNDWQSLFLNSCFYTDKAVGDFIAKARQTAWWENTVVVFVADHGHPLPGGKQITDKERYKIPMLMVGGAVKGDSLIHTFANQTDIANTVLGQLGAPNPAFRFSKNILSPSAQSFAVYFFNDGFGFVAPGQYLVYDNIGKQFLSTEGGSGKALDRSKSYEQILFTDYNNK